MCGRHTWKEKVPTHPERLKPELFRIFHIWWLSLLKKKNGWHPRVYDWSTFSFLLSARSGKLGKMLTTGTFPLRILSLITSLRTCTDLNRNMSENDVWTAESPFGVLELSISLVIFSFLILITSTRNLVASMKLKIGWLYLHTTTDLELASSTQQFRRLTHAVEQFVRLSAAQEPVI